MNLGRLQLTLLPSKRQKRISKLRSDIEAARAELRFALIVPDIPIERHRVVAAVEVLTKALK